MSFCEAGRYTVCVIGGMNMDVLGRGDSLFRMRDSNIGTIVFRPGGVGRNIAEKLARAGISTELFTVIGNDPTAVLLEQSCAELGIGLSFSLHVQEKSPVYMAIHDETGDMLTAVNDMSAMKYLTGEAVKEKAPYINRCGVCILDANLSEEALLAAARYTEVPILLDPVSCEKAKRCMGILDRVTAIKPNLVEAESMTGAENEKEAAERLLQKGVKNVYISLGKKGVYYACDKSRGYITPEKVYTGIQTGAGDAMCAGIAEAMTRSQGTEECARSGMRFSARLLEGKY